MMIMITGYVYNTHDHHYSKKVYMQKLFLVKTFLTSIDQRDKDKCTFGNVKYQEKFFLPQNTP